MRYYRIIAGVAAVLSQGCASSTVMPPPRFERQTTLVLAKPCVGGVCRCGDNPSDESQYDIAPGKKRFEFRLPHTTSSIWVAIQGKGVYFKSPESVEPVCFFVDLSPGEHNVTLHSETGDAEVGLQTGLTIREYGEAPTPNWYRSFSCACGGEANHCTQDELLAWRTNQHALPRGVLDPCGSVMVRGVSFAGTRASRQDSDYQTLTIRFTMKVYDFSPHRPPRSPDCKAPVRNR